MKNKYEEVQYTIKPDNWVMIEFDNSEDPNTIAKFKVFAGWFHEEWKMNSGVKLIEEDEDYYYFHGYSGSCYQCNKKRYGITDGIINFRPWVGDQLHRVIELSDGKAKIMDESTDFINLLNNE